MTSSCRKAPRMSGSGLEALPDNRKCLVRTSGCPGVVRRPSLMSGSGREAFRMSESV